MVALDYVLAAALLTAPPDSTTPPPAPPDVVALQPLLQQVALNWEILDPREVRYLLTRDDDFSSDLNLLRRRYHDLRDAPLVHDCMRFPSRTEVSELLTFNRNYRQFLERCRDVNPSSAWEIYETMTEVDRLYHLWDNIRDSRCDYYYVTIRRQALKRVRDEIGCAAFYNGQFPPHVPIWRFQRAE